MNRTGIILLASLLLSPFAAGCSDKRELDDQVYALTLGVDKGVENKTRITFQYPSYKGGKDGDSDGGTARATGGTLTSTVEAPSILEAINLLATSTTRRLSLVHIKAIVFSEDFAREGIGSFLQPIARFRETRRVVQFIVCKGTAEEFIKENVTFIGQSLSKAMDLKQLQADDTAFFPKTTFNNFYRSVISPYCQPYATYAGINHLANLAPTGAVKEPPLRTEVGMLPGTVPRKGNMKSELVGTAVFNGDRMIGTLDSYETRYFLMVIGDFKRGIMTLADRKDPDKAIVLDLRPGRRPRIKAQFNNEKMVIDVKINIEADISSIQSRFPYDQLSNIDELNMHLKETIQKGVEKVLAKSQKEFESDIFMFGYKVARNFSTIKEFEKYDWKTNYSKALVRVDVQTNVRRIGLMIESSPVKYNKAKLEESEVK